VPFFSLLNQRKEAKESPRFAKATQGRQPLFFRQLADYKILFVQ
jgi:hypothetical protein